MKFLAFAVLYIVPHFRTVYYLQWYRPRDGRRFKQILEDPLEIPENERKYIHCVRYLAVFGQPLFPRYSAYDSEEE